MKKIFLLACFIQFTLVINGQILINEFEPNPAGSDPANQSFEIKGTPSAAFNNLYVVSLECDDMSIGTADRVSGPHSGTFDGNGLAVLTIPDLENPSFTIVLCSSDPGIGTDLDTDDNAVIDNIPGTLGTIYDAIGVADASGDESNLYGTSLGGADFTYPVGPGTPEPLRTFRLADGTWYSAYTSGEVFDINGNSSPSSDQTITDFGSETTVLPISLTVFTATPQGNTIQLFWRTEMEENNDYMALERSTNGKNFHEIGIVNGAGTTIEAQEYTFVDEEPLVGINYYRIRQVDFDGATEYHRIIAASIENIGQSDIKLVPNQVDNQFNIIFPATMENEIQLSIFNLNGQQVHSETLQVQGDIKNINVSTLQAGMYLTTLTSTSGTITKRFIKK